MTYLGTPFYLIGDEDLVENGGTYKLLGRVAIPVNGLGSNDGIAWATDAEAAAAAADEHDVAVVGSEGALAFVGAAIARGYLGLGTMATATETDYLLTSGVRSGATSQAQDFSNGVNVNGVQALRVGLNDAGETLVGIAGGGAGYVGNGVTATGYYAARENTGANVTATGHVAAYQNTGANVTATGYYAARENTGANVTATGHSTARENTGANVTATGYYAARENTGANVTATGYLAAHQNTGANVTATGYLAAYQNTGANVTATGHSTAYQNTGANVTAVGYFAARNNIYANSIALGAFTLPTKANQAIIGAENALGTSLINALTIVSGASGGALEGLGKSSTTGQTAMARLAWEWNIATHATRETDVALYAEDYTTEREIMRGRANGSAAAIGFLGATPQTAPTYTPTNVTADRSYDANGTTTAELADVLGTLIADLQGYGLLV